MDERTREKVSEAMCDFLNAIICIADEGNYDRDSFVKAIPDMFATMVEISTFENFKTRCAEAPAMRWIEDHDYIKCPKCGILVKRDFTFFDIGDWNYCPNCGEKMEGGAANASD